MTMAISKSILENKFFLLSSLLKNSRLPLLVSPKQSGPVPQTDAICRLVEEQLFDVGGILFRGFEVLGQEQFQAFVG